MHEDDKIISSRIDFVLRGVRVSCECEGGGKKNRTVIERDIKKGYFIFGRIALSVPPPPFTVAPRSGENKKRLENVREITREIFLEKIIYFWPAHSCAFHYTRTSPKRHHQEKASIDLEDPNWRQLEPAKMKKRESKKFSLKKWIILEKLGVSR